LKQYRTRALIVGIILATTLVIGAGVDYAVVGTLKSAPSSPPLRLTMEINGSASIPMYYLARGQQLVLEVSVVSNSTLSTMPSVALNLNVTLPGQASGEAGLGFHLSDSTVMSSSPGVFLVITASQNTSLGEHWVELSSESSGQTNGAGAVFLVDVTS